MTKTNLGIYKYVYQHGYISTDSTQFGSNLSVSGNLSCYYHTSRKYIKCFNFPRCVKVRLTNMSRVLSIKFGAKSLFRDNCRFIRKDFDTTIVSIKTTHLCCNVNFDLYRVWVTCKNISTGIVIILG